MRLVGNAEFAIAEERYGGMHDAVIRFFRSDITVVVGADRGYWTLDFEVDGNLYDLGAVVDTRMKRTEWNRTEPAERRPPFVYKDPTDVVWLDEVPASVQWLLSTPTVVDDVTATKKRRSDARWS